ncbi:MAG: hypothetical protein DHS20C13_20100 [Thermodesulfobacteriota bacterium]|nr:MAG: hypothetical protein DHS20C13_20100 [Thermodesulfobacteriota bacterium]
MKDIYDEAMDTVAHKEPDTLSFTLYINDDESVFASFEVYKNSEGIIKNFQLSESRIGRVLAASDVIRCEIYGNASQELRELLSPYGTKFFNYNRGYNR